MSTEDTHDSLSVPRVRINCTHEIDQTKSKGFFNRITCCRPVLTFKKDSSEGTPVGGEERFRAGPGSAKDIDSILFYYHFSMIIEYNVIYYNGT